MPEEVDALESERVPNSGDFLDEEVDGPLERAGRHLRAPCADLVICDRAAARAAEIEQRLEVVARRSGPAVEEENRKLARLGLALLAIPRLEAAEWDPPFTHDGTVLPFRRANPAAGRPTLGA
jgi:hypothetical protein